MNKTTHEHFLNYKWEKVHMNGFFNNQMMFWGLAWYQLEVKKFPFKGEGVDLYKLLHYNQGNLT